MISSTFLIVPIVFAATTVARPTNPFVARATGDVRLSEWSSHSPPLESYWTFKNRFRALDCASQQGTDFYTSCCYPLDATQSLSDRPAECTPASSSCAASVQAVTSSSSSSAPAYTEPAYTAPAYTAPATTDANTASNDDDNADDDEDLPVCEDPNDDGEWHDDDDTDAYTYSAESVATTPSSDSAATTPSSDSAATTPVAETPSYTPEPTSSQAPQPTSDNNTGNTGNNGNSGETYSNAWATFFFQNGNPGACGNYHGEYDLIAALDSRMYGYDYSQPSSWCGRTVRVTNTKNGKTVDVMIQDACPTCDTSTSLDLSYGAFLQIAEEAEGHVPITWTPL